MAIIVPPLNAPPIRTPVVDRNGQITPAWAKWFQIIWNKTGSETDVAPISVTGSAAAVPPMRAAGPPEGTQQAPQGTIYVDTATLIKYYKNAGVGPNGWLPF